MVTSKLKKQASNFCSPTSIQYGALPYRLTPAHGIEILLVTTKESKRWIIPKGGPIKGLKPSKSAAREAFEEAGVRGATSEKAIGSFRFHKTLQASPDILCEVKVYALNVKRQMKTWPEQHQRRVRWCQPAEAQAAVNDIGLRSLIGLFVAEMMSHSASGKADELAPTFVTSTTASRSLPRTADVLA